MVAKTESRDSIAPLEARWDQLADRVSAPPFVRAGWIGAWHRAFGGGELTTVTVEREGRLAALLPLLRQRGVVRSPTNWHTPLFYPLAEDAEALELVLEATIRAAPRRLDLGFLPCDGDLTASFAAVAAGRGHAVTRRVVQQSPWLALDGDWEGFLAAMSSKRRTGLRRLRRRLEERGEVSVEMQRRP